MQIGADDPAAFAAHLFAHQSPLKIEGLGDSAVILFELGIMAIHYRRFGHVGPKMAMVARVSCAGMICVMGDHSAAVREALCFADPKHRMEDDPTPGPCPIAL